MQALPKAAQFLRDLKDQFGNLGLAAAAYNAGPARVRGWLAGARRLSALGGPGESPGATVGLSVTLRRRRTRKRRIRTAT